jgi:hypothetical protein
LAQICFFAEYARNTLRNPVSKNELASIFRTGETTVRRMLWRGLQWPIPPVAIVFDDNLEFTLVARVMEAFL